MKEERFNKLIEKMGKCALCTSFKNNKNLINFYQDDKLAKSIPSIWTDWYRNLNAEIFIIGQDWGPYDDIKKLYDRYMQDGSWQDLINEEKSLTKKNLIKFLVKSSNGACRSLDNIFFTNAIMCARCGHNYRDNNINLKKSTLNCSQFLFEQIAIVKPKVILTLGFYPLYSLANLFNFQVEKSLTKTIEKMPVIKVSDYIIIPLYHPAAQISEDKQLKQYLKIWDYIKRC